MNCSLRVFTLFLGLAFYLSFVTVAAGNEGLGPGDYESEQLSLDLKAAYGLEEPGISATDFGESGSVRVRMYLVGADETTSELVYDMITSHQAPSGSFTATALPVPLHTFDPEKLHRVGPNHSSSLVHESSDFSHALGESSLIYPIEISAPTGCSSISKTPNGPQDFRFYVRNGFPGYIDLNAVNLTGDCRDYFEHLVAHQSSLQMRVVVEIENAILREIYIPGLGVLDASELTRTPSAQVTTIDLPADGQLLGWATTFSARFPLVSIEDGTKILMLSEWMSDRHHAVPDRFEFHGYAGQSLEIQKKGEGLVFKFSEELNGITTRIDADKGSMSVDASLVGHTQEHIPIYSVASWDKELAFENSLTAHGHSILGLSPDGRFPLVLPTYSSTPVSAILSGFDDSGLPIVDLPIDIRATVAQPDEGNANGSIDLAIYPEYGNYTYTWSFNESLLASSHQNLNDLTSGKYTVLVSNNKGQQSIRDFYLGYQDVDWTELRNLELWANNTLIKSTNQTTPGHSAYASQLVASGQSSAYKFETPNPSRESAYRLILVNSQAKVVSSLNLSEGKLNPPKLPVSENPTAKVNYITHPGEEIEIVIEGRIVRYYANAQLIGSSTLDEEVNLPLALVVELGIGRVPNIQTNIISPNHDQLALAVGEIIEKANDFMPAFNEAHTQLAAWSSSNPARDRLEAARLAHSGMSNLLGYAGPEGVTHQLHFDEQDQRLTDLEARLSTLFSTYGPLGEEIGSAISTIQEGMHPPMKVLDYLRVMAAVNTIKKLLDGTSVFNFTGSQILELLETEISHFEPLSEGIATEAEQAARSMLQSALKEESKINAASEAAQAAEDVNFPFIEMPAWAMQVAFDHDGDPRQGYETTPRYSATVGLQGQVWPLDSRLQSIEDRQEESDYLAAAFAADQSLALPGVIVGEESTVSFWVAVTDTEEVSQQVIYSAETEGDSPKGLYRHGVHLRSLYGHAGDWNNPNIQFNQTGHYQLVLVSVPGQTFVYMYKPKGGGIPEFGYSTVDIHPNGDKLVLGASESLRTLSEFKSIHNLDDFRLYDQVLSQPQVTALSHFQKGSRVRQLDQLFGFVKGERIFNHTLIELTEARTNFQRAELEFFINNLRELHRLDRYLTTAIFMHAQHHGAMSTLQLNRRKEIDSMIEGCVNAFLSAVEANHLPDPDITNLLRDTSEAIDKFVHEHGETHSFGYVELPLNKTIDQLYENIFGIMTFDHMDIDDDDRVAKWEVEKIYDPSPELDEIFARFDKSSSDNFLSRAEFSGTSAGAEIDELATYFDDHRNVIAAGSVDHLMVFDYWMSGGETKYYGYSPGLTLMTTRQIDHQSFEVVDNMTMGGLPLMKLRKRHFGSAMALSRSQESKENHGWSLKQKVVLGLKYTETTVLSLHQMYRMYRLAKRIQSLGRLAFELRAMAISIADALAAGSLASIEMPWLFIAEVSAFVAFEIVYWQYDKHRHRSIDDLNHYPTYDLLTNDTADKVNEKVSRYNHSIEKIVLMIKIAEIQTDQDLRTEVRDIIKQFEDDYSYQTASPPAPAVCDYFGQDGIPGDIVHAQATDPTTYPKYDWPFYTGEFERTGEVLIALEQEMNRVHFEFKNSWQDQRNYSKRVRQEARGGILLYDPSDPNNNEDQMDASYERVKYYVCKSGQQEIVSQSIEKNIDDLIAHADLNDLIDQIRERMKLTNLEVTNNFLNLEKLANYKAFCDESLTEVSDKVKQFTKTIEEIVSVMQIAQTYSNQDINQRIYQMTKSFETNYQKPISNSAPAAICEIDGNVPNIDYSEVKDDLDYPRFESPYSDQTGTVLINLIEEINTLYYGFVNAYRKQEHYQERVHSSASEGLSLFDDFEQERIERQLNLSLTLSEYFVCNSEDQLNAANHEIQAINSLINSSNFKELLDELMKQFDNPFSLLLVKKTDDIKIADDLDFREYYMPGLNKDHIERPEFSRISMLDLDLNTDELGLKIWFQDGQLNLFNLDFPQINKVGMKLQALAGINGTFFDYNKIGGGRIVLGDQFFVKIDGQTVKEIEVLSPKNDVGFGFDNQAPGLGIVFPNRDDNTRFKDEPSPNFISAGNYMREGVSYVSPVGGICDKYGYNSTECKNYQALYDDYTGRDASRTFVARRGDKLMLGNLTGRGGANKDPKVMAHGGGQIGEVKLIEMDQVRKAIGAEEMIQLDGGWSTMFWINGQKLITRKEQYIHEYFVNGLYIIPKVEFSQINLEPSSSFGQALRLKKNGWLDLTKWADELFSSEETILTIRFKLNQTTDQEVVTVFGMRRDNENLVVPKSILNDQRLLQLYDTERLNFKENLNFEIVKDGDRQYIRIHHMEESKFRHIGSYKNPFAHDMIVSEIVAISDDFDQNVFDGQWHHMAIKLDMNNSEAVFYLDGLNIETEENAFKNDMLNYPINNEFLDNTLKIDRTLVHPVTESFRTFFIGSRIEVAENVYKGFSDYSGDLWIDELSYLPVNQLDAILSTEGKTIDHFIAETAKGTIPDKYQVKGSHYWQFESDHKFFAFDVAGEKNRAAGQARGEAGFHGLLIGSYEKIDGQAASASRIKRDPDQENKKPQQSRTPEVYPNPHENHFDVQLSLDQDREVHVVLYDLKGTRIDGYEAVLSAGQQIIRYNSVGLPIGVYVLKVSYGQQVYTENVIKK